MIENLKKHIKKKTKVYSVEHGAGEVISIFKLYDGVEDHFEVKFYNSEKTEFFSINNLTKLRFTSNSETLTQILRNLAEKLVSEGSRKSNKSYQRIGVDEDLNFLTRTIVRLINRKDLSRDETLTLSRCIKSLVQEVSDVFNIDESRAMRVVSDYTRFA